MGSPSRVGCCLSLPGPPGGVKQRGVRSVLRAHEIDALAPRVVPVLALLEADLLEGVADDGVSLGPAEPFAQDLGGRHRRRPLPPGRPQAVRPEGAGRNPAPRHAPEGPPARRPPPPPTPPAEDGRP